jgi:hypothetical protein
MASKRSRQGCRGAKQRGTRNVAHASVETTAGGAQRAASPRAAAAVAEEAGRLSGRTAGGAALARGMRPRSPPQRSLGLAAARRRKRPAAVPPPLRRERRLTSRTASAPSIGLMRIKPGSRRRARHACSSVLPIFRCCVPR